MKKEDLRRFREMKKGEQNLRDNIAALELRRLSPRSPAYDSERVQTSISGDVMPEQLAKIDRLIDRYKKELSAVLDMQEQFEQLIAPLTPRRKLIMRCYYVKGMIWEEVWQEIHISTRHLMRIHGDVLDELFPEEAKNGEKEGSDGRELA